MHKKMIFLNVDKRQIFLRFMDLLRLFTISSGTLGTFYLAQILQMDTFLKN